MVGRTSDWKGELGRFLKPFLERLSHKARRRMCPLYVSGLIGPGDRKSVQPMAERDELGDLRSIAPLHRGRGLRMQGWWRRNCWFKLTSWSAAAMPCW